MTRRSGLWVFGYGSLIWNPGFPVAERHIARLPGFHRCFCMRSIHHRGTEKEPGLVLALDREDAAACTGVAFRIAEGAEEPSLAELRERELVSSAYVEVEVDLTLPDGAPVRAITYVVDPDHVQYCGRLPLDEQAAIIARAVGGRGPNSEYLYNTASHLDDLGIVDEELRWLNRTVREMTASSD